MSLKLFLLPILVSLTCSFAIADTKSSVVPLGKCRSALLALNSYATVIYGYTITPEVKAKLIRKGIKESNLPLILSTQIGVPVFTNVHQPFYTLLFSPNEKDVFEARIFRDDKLKEEVLIDIDPGIKVHRQMKYYTALAHQEGLVGETFPLPFDGYKSAYIPAGVYAKIQLKHMISKAEIEEIINIPRIHRRFVAEEHFYRGQRQERYTVISTTSKGKRIKITFNVESGRLLIVSAYTPFEK